MKYEFSQNQIAETKERIRKKIFYLILYVDPETSKDYPNVDVSDAIDNVLNLVSGFNDLMGCPNEVVMAMSYLTTARRLYNSNNYSWMKYRKLILDAGSEIGKIKEV